MTQASTRTDAALARPHVADDRALRSTAYRVARPWSRRLCGVLLALVSSAPSRAAAQTPASPDPVARPGPARSGDPVVATAAAPAPAPPPPEPRAPAPLPAIAAVFPGILLHGSGAWLQGRNQTAQRLALLEGAAVLTTFASGLILFETGAARDVVGPTALGAVAGVGTFGVSFLANVYAAWAPPDGLGLPLRRSPLLESSAGYLYVYDPQFAYRHFATLQVVARPLAWRLAANAAVAPGQDNRRIELGAGYRVLGVSGRGGAAASDGSYLEPRLGWSEHRFEDEGFASRVIEIAIEGRLDADRYLPDVRGAFFQGEAGYGRQQFRNDVPGPNPETSTSLLLAHVGFGIYLGNRTAGNPTPSDPADPQTGGEVQLYYDHRHDGFAGGLKANGLGSGVAGHFGILGSYQLSREWGVRLRTEVGSAYTFGLDAVFRTW